MRWPAVAALSAACIAVPAAQDASPRFEVASIKANQSGAREVQFGMPGGGRFTATNAPLREIIRLAYGVPDFLIVDAPGWIATERFDIVAKADGNPGFEPMRLMLRSLLRERFALSLQMTTRELPRYLLMRVKPDSLGPTLRAAAADCPALLAAARNGTPIPKSNRILCGRQGRPGMIAIGGQTMDEIAEGFWPVVQRVVINRTGLDGRFDADLQYAPDPAASSELPSIFTAVQEQLGLKLEPGTGPVDVLVVDHVERPADN